MADTEANTADPIEPIVVFKKSKPKGNIRKRPRDDDEEQTEDSGPSNTIQPNEPTEDSNVVKKKKDSAEGGVLSATTKKERDKEFLGVKFATTGLAELSGDQGATREFMVDDNQGRAGNTAGQKGLRAGPQRAVGNLRLNARFDYQPDICKDYKETGYCGYGDSCKFLHDRGDYKAGWQIERDWKEEEKKKATEAAIKLAEGEKESEDEEDGEDLPFACLICRESFKDPVKTKCGHYFCSACAISHHRRSGKCFACAAPTGGLFSIAKELLVKLEEKRKRMEEREKVRAEKRARDGVVEKDEEFEEEEEEDEDEANEDEE